MPLSKYERKEKLGVGGQTVVAEALGVSKADVSRVINDKADTTVKKEKAQKIRREIAKRLRLPIREVFGSAA